MKRTINLDTKEIKALIKELNNYSNNIPKLCRLFFMELANIGIDVVNANYGIGLGDSSKDHKCEYQFDEEGNVIRCKILVTGKDILFIEFGSGIRFNNGNTHPYAHELGYGVGSYPHQKHAYDPNGWYYRVPSGSKDGVLHHSLGTQATMPLYKASMEIISKIEEVAEEVFSSG